MKKLVVLALAVVMVLSLSTTALANIGPRGGGGWGSGGWGGCPGGGMGLMWDDNGSFVSRDAFEQRVDDLIESGVIASADRAALLDMYDWCAENGFAGGRGGRGGCGGFGGGARGQMWSRR